MYLRLRGKSSARGEGAEPLYANQTLLAYRENAGEPDSWSSLSCEIPYGDCFVRHHRELDIYTVTSESESRHEAPFPGDTCTGHIFKLINIQQQLMVRKKKSIFKRLCPHFPPPVNLLVIRTKKCFPQRCET